MTLFFFTVLFMKDILRTCIVNLTILASSYLYPDNPREDQSMDMFRKFRVIDLEYIVKKILN